MEKKITKKAVDKELKAKKDINLADEKPVKRRRAARSAAVEAAPKRSIKLVKKDTGAVIAIDPFAQPVTEIENVLELPETVKLEKKRSSSKTKPVKAKARVAKAVATDETTIEAVATKPARKKTVKAAAKKPAKSKKLDLDVTAEIAAKEPEVKLSPVFKALADVKLPDLKKENRARLLMQSPTRAYFYWSVRENPWQQLRSVFGADLGSYTLVLKLSNLTAGTEDIKRAEAEGEWWFDVEPDTQYAAEIGFYAPNRPYFRIVYSNTIETPRRSPSPHPASDARWTVSANKFAEVLDVSGFSRDAFDVAMAGDNVATSDDVTRIAFSQFAGVDHPLGNISSEDIRYAMLSIAAGLNLEELRSRVSPSLFAILQANAEKLAAENARATLSEHFDIDETEWTEHETGSTVFGASLVHFPRTLKARKVTPKYSPRYNPVSSHSLR